MGERGNMLRLLALVATTLAAPQYLSPYGGYLYPQYTGYPMGLYGYPNYSPVRMAYPTTQYIPMVQAMNQPQSPNTRQLVKFENFMEINGNFATSTTQASLVVVRTINLSQNLVTDFLNGNEAQYKIYVQSSGTTDLTGKNIRLGLLHHRHRRRALRDFCHHQCPSPAQRILHRRPHHRIQHQWREQQGHPEGQVHADPR